MNLFELLAGVPVIGKLFGGNQTQQPDIKSQLDEYFGGGVKFGQGINPLYLVIGVVVIVMTLIIAIFANKK